MWEYPKSQLHQTAIDEMKPERDREALRAAAAEMKLRREREAAQAIKDHEAQRLATLAKTQRLRAERLARIEAEAQKPKRGAVGSRSAQSPKM
jgi:hypothetical protein